MGHPVGNSHGNALVCYSQKFIAFVLQNKDQL